MKFLFNYKIIVREVIRLAVVFKILFHYLICYISSTQRSISNSPKVSSPVSLLKIGKFFLQPSRTSSFQSLHKITNRSRGWNIQHGCAHGLCLLLPSVFLHLQTHKSVAPNPCISSECLLQEPDIYIS